MMNFLFADATSFNSNLSSWNVSSVYYMNGMFLGAASFNDNLSNWDVSSVNDMTSMFEEAADFNQDLCNWGDKFPYDSASNIFDESGCTTTAEPLPSARGPFCASLSCPNAVKR